MIVCSFTSRALSYINIKRMRLHAFAAVVLALITACDDTDYKSYFSDINITTKKEIDTDDEGAQQLYIESLWEVCTITEYYGLNLGDDFAVNDNPESGFLYVRFFKDGSGKAFNVYQSEVKDSVCFSYRTDDGYHIETEYNGEKQQWTFARRDKWGSGRREQDCVVYRESIINGQKIFYWYSCCEIRNDSLLYYEDSVLRGLVSVPESRVWTKKDVTGEYSVRCGVYYEFDQKTFPYRGIELMTLRSDSTAVINPGNWDEEQCSFSVKSGQQDTITFLLANGEKTSFRVEYHNRGFFLYDDAVRTVIFSNRYSNMDGY